MIAATFNKDDKSVMILLVLEPGNIEKLKRGEPVHKFLHEFIPNLPTNVELLLAYTPDAVWVAEQMAGGLTKEKLIDAIAASQTREPVLVRDRTAEEMKRRM